MKTSKNAYNEQMSQLAFMLQTVRERSATNTSSTFGQLYASNARAFASSIIAGDYKK